MAQIAWRDFLTVVVSAVSGKTTLIRDPTVAQRRFVTLRLTSSDLLQHKALPVRPEPWC